MAMAGSWTSLKVANGIPDTNLSEERKLIGQ